MKAYSITFSGRFHYIKGEGVALHKHDKDYQIQLIYGGKAKAKVNGDEYILEAGNVFFLKIGCAHEFSVISDEGLKTLEVKFSNPSENLVEICDSIKILFSDKDDQLFTIFSKIVSEGYKKLPDYKLMSTTLLTEGLIKMKRICNMSDEDVEPILSHIETKSSQSRILATVTDYIYKNFDKKISLSDLAEECGYHKDYLYRIIKRETNLTAVQYINMIRFEQAKHLIQHSEMTLSEISWSLGFDSLQYFSKFFRQRAKMTPSEYKERMRNKIRTDY